MSDETGTCGSGSYRSCGCGWSGKTTQPGLPCCGQARETPNHQRRQSGSDCQAGRGGNRAPGSIPGQDVGGVLPP